MWSSLHQPHLFVFPFGLLSFLVHVMRPLVIPARLSTCESRLYPHGTRDPREDQGTSPACTPLCVCAQPPQPLSLPCSPVSIFTSCLALYLSFSLMQRNYEEEDTDNPRAPHQERTFCHVTPLCGRYRCCCRLPPF